MNIAAERERE